MSEWKLYRRKGFQSAKPWTKDEDMTFVEIPEEMGEPKEGGMILRHPKKLNEFWYVSPEWFSDFFER